VDGSGNLYVVDGPFNDIVKVSPAGVLSQFFSSHEDSAGNWISNASINVPSGVAIDASGTLYIADTGGQCIRKITQAQPGISTILAGTLYVAGSANGTGTAASFNNPTGVAVDAAGNIYVADNGNNRIRKITPVGVVSNLGTADFVSPYSLVVDPSGNVYVTDSGEGLIKKITPTGQTSIFAGVSGSNTTQNNGSPGTATFIKPMGITIDSHNMLYVTDANEVRKIGLQ
jgi:hypothetical protein